ncbi:DUF1707 and DUF4190 domain-containing protein [Kitasatospora sp. NPDC056138]|uniref:DUF1707 and DUF4190 domain-containing protein n=1 Tax=Kitasatospora sp. NPDC056138 TaxID=3345724 RepID=UPI0035DBD19E
MAVEPWEMKQPSDSPFAGSRPPVGHPPEHRQSWPQPPAAQPAAAQPAVSAQAGMRAAHTDRERTVDVLKAAFAEGRLDTEEYAQRFDAANRAKTYGELSRLVADLPAGPFVAPQGAPAPAVPSTFLPPPVFLAPPKPRTNPLAVTSMVLGLLTIPTMGATGVPAVVTGHVARAQLRSRDEPGDGMATVGLVLGWLSIAAWALMILAILIAASGPAPG